MRSKAGLSMPIIALSAVLAFTGCDDAEDAEAEIAVQQNGSLMPVVSSDAASGRYAVMDSMALGRPAPALDLAPPKGWRAESAVRWDNINGQCSYAIASPMFKLTSPDGKASIEQMPGFLVTTNESLIRGRGSSPGDFCVMAMVGSPQEFVERVAVPFLRPQARIEGMREMAFDPPVQAIAQSIARVPAMGGSQTIPYQIEATVSNADGTQEKLVFGGVMMVGQQMMPGVPPLMLNQNNLAYAVRAPADRMAEVEAIAVQVRASVRPNPEWVASVQAMQNRLTKPVFPKPGGGGGGYAGGGSASGGGYAGGTTIGQGVNSDGAQRQRIDSIREEERCADGRVVSIHVGC